MSNSLPGRLRRSNSLMYSRTTDGGKRAGFGTSGKPTNFTVAGCGGFVGWKVTEFLLGQGHTAVKLDNLDDPYNVRLKSRMLNGLVVHPRIGIRRVDVVSSIHNSAGGSARGEFDAKFLD